MFHHVHNSGNHILSLFCPIMFKFIHYCPPLPNYTFTKFAKNLLKLTKMQLKYGVNIENNISCLLDFTSGQTMMHLHAQVFYVPK